MLGAGFGFITTQITVFIKRQAIIYGLMAGGGLVFVFAVGYGLDALRAAIALRLGLVYASLIIAGGMLALALLCIAIAMWMSRATASAPQKSMPASPYSNPPRRSIVSASAVLAGGAITGLVAGILAARPSWRTFRQDPVAADIDRQTLASRPAGIWPR